MAATGAPNAAATAHRLWQKNGLNRRRGGCTRASAMPSRSLILVPFLLGVPLGGCLGSPAANEGLASEVGASPEPQSLDPALDAALIGELGLAVQVPDDLPRFNVAIVGQDGRAGSAARRPLADGRDALASRADSITILSVDRSTGHLTLLSIYRGWPTPASCWDGMAEQSGDPNELIITNLYRLGGRRGFVPCLEDALSAGLQNLPELLDGAGRFEIHAMVEANFDSFRQLFGEARKAAEGSLGLWNAAVIAWTYAGHISQVRWMAEHRDEILLQLRERHSYAAGGYQRAFNHARFLVDALGYLGYGRFHDEGLLGRLGFLLDLLSRSLPLDALETGLTTWDGGSTLVDACFHEGHSSVPVIGLGSRFGSGSDHYVFAADEIDLGAAKTSLLRLIDPAVRVLPAPDDCD